MTSSTTIRGARTPTAPGPRQFQTPNGPPSPRAPVVMIPGSQVIRPQGPPLPTPIRSQSGMPPPPTMMSTGPRLPPMSAVGQSHVRPPPPPSPTAHPAAVAASNQGQGRPTPPVSAPAGSEPDLSHLSAEERRQIAEVLARAEQQMAATSGGASAAAAAGGIQSQQTPGAPGVTITANQNRIMR